MVSGYTRDIGASLKTEKYTMFTADPSIKGIFTTDWIDPQQAHFFWGGCEYPNNAGNSCHGSSRLINGDRTGGCLSGKYRYNCLSWDQGGKDYCPHVPGANIQVQFNGGQAKQKCTYDMIPREIIFNDCL
jgi:hypothetical protein